MQSPPLSVNTYINNAIQIRGGLNVSRNIESSISFESDINGGWSVLNLNGHSVRVVGGEISVNTSNGSWIQGTGFITSTGNLLDIKVNVRTASDRGLNIESIIADSGHKVGLRVSGNRLGEGVVFLTGSQLNTFTGNVESILKFNKYLYLDDLLINKGGSLTVRGWLDGQEFLLVRKESKGLADALNKMEFEGYDRNKIHLVDFNKEYWSISAAPEPASYGAFLAIATLGFAAWRRRCGVAAAIREKRPLLMIRIGLSSRCDKWRGKRSL